MEFACLASGSKANAYIVKNGCTQVLIDCGLSLRELKKRLEKLVLSIESLSAVIVTHEHDDHIAGIKRLCTNYQIPLYLTEAVYENGEEFHNISLHQIFFFSPDTSFDIGGLSFECFNVPHDAVQTVSLRVWNGEKSLCILTDIGEFDQGILDRVDGADALIIEANHDQELLNNCRYPYYIKKRISGPKGHLGNHRTADFIKQLVKNKQSRQKTLQFLGAAHISENSNTPELAFAALKEGVKGLDVLPKLFLAKQREVSELFVL